MPLLYAMVLGFALLGLLTIALLLYVRGRAVFASTLSIVVALNAGFRITLATGAVCYAGALAIVVSLRNAR